MRSRWDQVREDPWLQDEVDQSFHPVRVGTDHRAVLLQEMPHTMVLKPWCLRHGLVGLHVDTNVEAWYAWYGFDEPDEKRWGRREDRAMPDFAGRPPTETAVVWFQRTRGLEVDGWAGPDTRRALIEEYMGQDGTKLPDSATLTRHGCGESFPTEAGGRRQAPSAGGDISLLLPSLRPMSSSTSTTTSVSISIR